MILWFGLMLIFVAVDDSGFEVPTAVLLDIPDNMGFESFAAGDPIPFNWVCEGEGFVCVTDSSVSRSGMYSARLECTGGDQSGGYMGRTIPFGYTGETVTFSGWIMGESQSDSAHSGIFLLLTDSEDNLLESGRLEFPDFPGGSQWEYFTLSVPVSSIADSVFFGVDLSGAGSVWVDDLSLLIDGHLLVETPLRDQFPASLDHAFDTGSGVVLGDLSPFQFESLELLGKVWAFLKYHHPVVCSGELNWDYELFRVLPSVIAAEDKASREAAMLELLPGLDPLEPCECTVLPEAEVRMRGDFSWINGETLGNSLAFLLQAVYAGRHQGDGFYVQSDRLTVFSEESYPDIDISDDGYRLLSLYRYWGMVEYYFPYRYATDTNWSEQLRISLPLFTDAESPLEYQLAVARLFASVGDTHARILTEPDQLATFLGRFHTPLDLSLIEGRWVITGFLHPSAAESPLRKGDVILECDGVPVSETVAGLLPYTSGSTPWAVMENLGSSLLRGRSGTASLLIERQGQQFELSISRVPGDEIDRALAAGPAVGEGSFTVLDEGFGYMDLGSLQLSEVDAMKEAFRPLPGIVLDLRGYPSDSVLYAVADFLLPAPEMFCIFTWCDYSNPGTFFRADSVYAGGGDPQYYQGKVALLVDEGSVSSSEFHAMAWRLAPESRVFGHATSGTDGNVVSLVLPGGIETRFTGVGVYNPDGSETQRVGIPPDEVVTPTVEGLQAGRDEVLEAALSWLLTP